MCSARPRQERARPWPSSSLPSSTRLETTSTGTDFGAGHCSDARAGDTDRDPGLESRALHPFNVQCVYGGTNMKTEQNKFARQRCDILVATPGHLQDHLDNCGLGDRLQQLRTFILDEADQLLEMGFRPAITKIAQQLPKNRQVGDHGASQRV
mmetsp:Transcript_34260/g.73970  ORF Transcript_34260/g.73970 Transcript_34260/m.73970 type:complete len:153 (-) Transcript_34260:12-470(-)